MGTSAMVPRCGANGLLGRVMVRDSRAGARLCAHPAAPTEHSPGSGCTRGGPAGG